MSSPRLSALLSSSVFRVTLLSSASVSIIAVGLLWLACFAIITWSEQGLRVRIQAGAERAALRFEQGGLDGVIDIIAPDGRRMKSREELAVARSESELFGVLRRHDYQPVAGFAGLYGAKGWSEGELDYVDIDQQVIAYQFALDEDYTATFALFVPSELTDLRGFAASASIAIGVIALPLAIITGLLLSWIVHRRLADLASTVEGVTAGRMEERVPLSGTGDEFERLSMSLNQMLDRLEALTRNIEQVTVGVAHDLKTPLSNIRGRLQLMGRDIEDREAVVRHIEMAEQHMETLLQTFNALLRLGEVEAGSRHSGFERVDLSSVMRDLADSFVPVFVDADKELTVQVDPEIAIQGDEALLIQMACNLLENIIDHSRDGAMAWIKLSADGNTARLEIGDDGPGIPPLHHDRLFERFFRGDASRTTPGNGLGLSLVKAIADLHTAKITIDPRASGLVLVISFPITAEIYNSV